MESPVSIILSEQSKTVKIIGTSTSYVKLKPVTFVQLSTLYFGISRTTLKI